MKVGLTKQNMCWVIVLLLFIVNIINYLDRSALSIALPLIEKDLNITPAEFGIIFGSFFFGYAMFNFLGGIASDKFGAKITLIGAVTLWSIFCGLTSLANGFISLLILRVLFGMAEGPIFAGGSKMINGWFPKRRAATALGLLSAGSPVGGAVAGPVVGYLALTVGWRLAFFIICCIGLVWVVFWCLISANNPDQSKLVSDEERRRINHSKQEEQENDELTGSNQNYSLFYYIKKPIILSNAFAYFCYNYILFFFLSWFPAYLVQAHGLDIQSMSYMTMIPWIVGFFGLASGGFISDFILKLTGKVFFSRKIILFVCLLLSAVFVGLAGVVETVGAAVSLMSCSIFCLYITGSIYFAIVQDNVHKSKVGSVTGFVHFISSLAGIASPIITGFIVQNTGRFDSAFILAGVVATSGAIFSLIFIRAPKNK